tara:strand:+ start:93 stop:515 length:423 start_codon:yes stop_codon:yes gene_type:complete
MKLKHPYNIITIFIAFMLFMLLVAVSGCTVYKTPKPNITHVLAITAEGDTLKLPIDVIRPIYNYNTYPTNRYPVTPNYFHYSPWRNHSYNQGNVIIRNGTGNTSNNSSNSGSGPNTSSPAVVTPPPNPPNPVINNPKKNN